LKRLRFFIIHMTYEEQRGYNAAMSSNENPQSLMNQSVGQEDDPFTRGWQKACEERGAVHPLDN